MNPFRYYPDSDMLTIDLSQAPASGGGADAAEGVVLLYDEKDRLVGIEIDNASKRVDLTDIKKNPAYIVDDSGGPVEILTVAELAERLEVGPRSIQKSIQTMQAAGIEVGLKSTQKIPNAPILLTEEDIEAIQTWRQAHPRGRPKEKAVLGEIEMR